MFYNYKYLHYYICLAFIKLKRFIMNWKTKKVKLSEVKEYENNPRKITEKGLNALKDSIKAFGQAEPLVVNIDMVLIGGHARKLAMESLNHTHCDVLIPDVELTEKQVQELNIRLNKNIAGEFDFDILANFFETDDLLEWGFEDFELGFETTELEAEEDDYEAPDVIETDIVAGDLIEIGKHRLLCGDSTDSDAVAKLMDGETPDLIHTDPPYGMNAVSKSGVLSKNYDGDIIGDDNPDIAKDAFNLIHSIYNTVKQVWWGANYYCSVLPDSECWLVWDKNNGGSDQTDAELAWCNYRSVVRKFTKASEKTNRVHPTQKPVELVQWVVDWSKIEVKNIADFFGGSGVTAVWAHQKGVKSFTMEYDPKYCQVIIDRMLKLDNTLEVKINGKKYENK